MSLKRFSVAVVLLTTCVMDLPSATVFADGQSVTQIITISATVAPARSIVLNDQGEIVTVYSNTADDVVPKVYVGDVKTANQRPLTNDIYTQYQQIIASQKNLVGVEIPVKNTELARDTTAHLFLKNVSILLMKF